MVPGRSGSPADHRPCPHRDGHLQPRCARFYLASYLLSQSLTSVILAGLAVVGAALVERAGRRKLWLFSTGGMLLSYIILIAVSATFASSGSKSLGLCSVAFMFICVRHASRAPLSPVHRTSSLLTSLPRAVRLLRYWVRVPGRRDTICMALTHSRAAGRHSPLLTPPSASLAPCPAHRLFLDGRLTRLSLQDPPLLDARVGNGALCLDAERCPLPQPVVRPRSLRSFLLHCSLIPRFLPLCAGSTPLGCPPLPGNTTSCSSARSSVSPSRPSRLAGTLAPLAAPSSRPC